MATIPSVEEIRAKVAIDSRWAERGIVAIYRNQTADEKVDGATKHDNGIGFNGTDARILSSFAKQILGERQNDWPLDRTAPTPRHLSEKQLAVAFRLMPKYARQLHRIATRGAP